MHYYNSYILCNHKYVIYETDEIVFQGDVQRTRINSASERPCPQTTRWVAPKG